MKKWKKKNYKENSLSQDWNSEAQESAPLPPPLSHLTVVKGTERQAEPERISLSLDFFIQRKSINKMLYILSLPFKCIYSLCSSWKCENFNTITYGHRCTSEKKFLQYYGFTIMILLYYHLMANHILLNEQANPLCTAFYLFIFWMPKYQLTTRDGY